MFNVLFSRQNDEDIVEEDDPRKYKKGIIYLSTIPTGIDVSKIREIFSQFGDVGRIYLEKDTATKAKGKKTKFHRYTEGWIEFKKKKIAKRVALMLNGQQVGGKRRSIYYDCIWSIKYLHRFKWHHLREQIAQERALNEQRLRFEIQQARKETNFFLEMSEKRGKKKSIANLLEKSAMLQKKQTVSDETIRSTKNDTTDGVDVGLLEKIFK